MKNRSEDWGDFEIFTNVKTKKTGSSFITIAKHGTATLNSGFMAKNHEQMKGKTHVKLGYSRSKNAIALEFTDDEKDQASIKLTKNKKSNCSFAIRSFANHYSLNLERIAGRYELDVEPIPRWGNYFTINLGL